jgi:hypothetical protein
MDIEYLTPPKISLITDSIQDVQDAVVRAMGIPAHILSGFSSPIGNVLVEGDMKRRCKTCGDRMDFTEAVWVAQKGKCATCLTSKIERRIVNGDELDNTVVVWELFECDDGARWAQLKGSPINLCKQDGDICDFGGCRTGHRTWKKQETSNREEANNWFREPIKEG